MKWLQLYGSVFKVDVTYKEMDSKELAKKLKSGMIFIYPGNEAYEIICDVLAKDSVERLLKAKIDGINSLLVSDKKWILNNLQANKRYIEKLPGPFTFLLKTKRFNKIPKYTINDNLVGIRIANNNITKALSKENIILFSYILKRKGRLVIDPCNITKDARKACDFLIDEGVIEMKPHVVIDLTGKIAKIVKQ